jgi:acyl-coenzyme A synthetase/AMP-(fatty) acid ligase
MIEIIQTYKATVCFTAPTAYRVMLSAMEDGADLSSLRAAVSAGETLPKPVYDAWIAKTGKPMLDGIGATEMLHIFVTNRFDDHRPACTGKPVTGYEAKVVDDDGAEVPRRRSGGWRCGAPPAAAISAGRGRRNMCRTAGTSPATALPAMKTAISTLRRATTT